jgi:hypothetical protein
VQLLAFDDVSVAGVDALDCIEEVAVAMVG